MHNNQEEEEGGEKREGRKEKSNLTLHFNQACSGNILIAWCTAIYINLVYFLKIYTLFILVEINILMEYGFRVNSVFIAFGLLISICKYGCE